MIPLCYHIYFSTRFHVILSEKRRKIITILCGSFLSLNSCFHFLLILLFSNATAHFAILSFRTWCGNNSI